MKAQMEVLLSMWGRWAVRRAAGALGYPSVSPMFKQMPHGDSYGSQSPLGVGEPEMLLVDAAVNRLPDAHKLVVLRAYQYGDSMRAIGRRLGITHVTVGKYIAEAHHKISVDIELASNKNPRNSENFDKCHCKPATA